MAGERRRRRHRSRPARGEARAVLDGYAALSGGREVPGAVARLWDAATCADMTPARTYLSRRGCWPGRHVRAPLPAESVRWLDVSRAPERDEAGGWYGLPAGAAGAVAFCWWRKGNKANGIAFKLAALTLVPLDARGFPVPETRSGVGNRCGAMFRAGNMHDEGAVTVQADDEGRPHADGWLETPWLEVLGGRT